MVLSDDTGPTSVLATGEAAFVPVGRATGIGAETPLGTAITLLTVVGGGGNGSFTPGAASHDSRHHERRDDHRGQLVDHHDVAGFDHVDELHQLDDIDHSN